MKKQYQRTMMKALVGEDVSVNFPDEQVRPITGKLEEIEDGYVVRNSTVAGWTVSICFNLSSIQSIESRAGMYPQLALHY
jgi:hypothetical protein